MKKLFAFTFLCFLYAYTGKVSSAITCISPLPDGMITGLLMDQTSGEPVEFASVALYRGVDSSLVSGVMSDEQGAFSFFKLSKGKYYITIIFIGYEKKSIGNIEIDDQVRSRDLGKIRLVPSAKELQAVQITGKASVLSGNVDKQVINTANSLTAAGGTAADLLRSSPSITTSPEGEVGIRGNSNFIVLINGKPTSMKPNEILKNTPANMIEKIEVITNPSVKYDAEGTAGIINIILKKNASMGLNGQINSTLGLKDKYSAGILLNMNRKKTNTSFGLEWKDFSNQMEHDYYRTLFRNDTIYQAYMFQDRLHRDKLLDLRFGFDYSPDSSNNFSYSLNAGQTEKHIDIVARNGGYSNPYCSEVFMRNRYDFSIKPTYFTNNASYSRELMKKGNTLSFNVYYSFIDYRFYNKQVFEMADHSYNSIDTMPRLHNVINNNFSQDIRGNIDYVLPVSDRSTLEAGLAYSNYYRQLNVALQDFDHSTGSWMNDSLYTDIYSFNEMVTSGYINWNGQFQKIKFTAGLRADYMDRILRKDANGSSYEFSRINYFPGVSLTRSYGDKQTIKLSYSSRINRPDEYQMNPFPEFEDAYFYGEGNPYLLPELSRKAELNFQKFIRMNTMVSASAFYSTTADKIVQQFQIGKQDKLHLMNSNDCTDQSVGIEFNGKTSLKKWWELSVGASAYDYRIWGNVVGTPYSGTMFSWNVHLMNSFEFNRSTSLVLVGYYNSRTIYSQGVLDPFGFVDVGIKKTVMKEKLSFNLQVNDIFKSKNYHGLTEVDNMQLNAYFKNESPIFLITITYQLNQFKKLTKNVETEFDM